MKSSIPAPSLFFREAREEGATHAYLNENPKHITLLVDTKDRNE